MKPQDEVALERVLADTAGETERAEFLARVDRDPQLQKALCDALCEDVMLMELLAVEQAAAGCRPEVPDAGDRTPAAERRRSPAQFMRRHRTVSILALAALLLASVSWLTVWRARPTPAPTPAPPAGTTKTVLAQGEPATGRGANGAVWSFAGAGSLRRSRNGESEHYRLRDGRLYWHHDGVLSVPTIMSTPQLDVRPIGTRFVLASGTRACLLQVLEGSVQVTRNQRMDGQVITAPRYLAYGDRGKVMTGGLARDVPQPSALFLLMLDDGPRFPDMLDPSEMRALSPATGTRLVIGRHGVVPLGGAGLLSETSLAERSIHRPTQRASTIQIRARLPAGLVANRHYATHALLSPRDDRNPAAIEPIRFMGTQLHCDQDFFLTLVLHANGDWEIYSNEHEIIGSTKPRFPRPAEHDAHAGAVLLLPSQGSADADARTLLAGLHFRAVIVWDRALSADEVRRSIAYAPWSYLAWPDAAAP